MASDNSSEYDEDARSRAERLTLDYNDKTTTIADLRDHLRAVRAALDTERDNINDVLPEYQELTTETERENFLKKNKILDRIARDRNRCQLMEAQAHMEDFLFYQNSVNRWMRLRPVPPTRRMREEARNFRRRPMMIHSEVSERVPSYATYLRELLNFYDRNKIGTMQYRLGAIDENGQDRSQPKDSPHLVPVDELHLWIPRLRHPPSGLRLNSSLYKLQRYHGEPYRIRPDIAAITARNDDLKAPKDHDTPELEYSSHAERQQAEREVFASNRPTTAGLQVTKTHRGQVTQDRFREIKVGEVFISALESSHDWATSYDCLGLVQTGSAHITIETSAVREEDLVEGESDEEESIAKARKTRSKSGAKKMKGKPPQYPHERFEFSKKRVFREQPLERLVTTSWVEATNGRRERHVSIADRPSSPVDSPPHSPVQSPIDDDTIPISSDNSTLRHVEEGIRRCSHNNKQCRAWWSHAPDECWEVHTETAILPTDRSGIDPPAIPSELSSRGREIYRDRLHDHYGRLKAQWPRVGIRVPYEPTTFADFEHRDGPRDGNRRKRLKVAPSDAESDGGEASTSDEGRHTSDTGHDGERPRDNRDLILQEWRSLSVPITTDAQEPWNQNSNTKYINVEEDESSDDENDLFRKSYLDGPHSGGGPVHSDAPDNEDN
jgi:hypothetical protein